MAKEAKNQNPKWWRDLPDNEYKVAAYAYMQASYEAHLAASKVMNEETISDTEGSRAKLLTAFADHLEPQLKDGPGLNDLENPPPLHATMYATRTYGLEKMREAILGLGWIEKITEHLREKNAPVAAIVSAVETLPDHADTEMLIQALMGALTQSLGMPKTHSNPAIIVATVDVWIKKLIGDGLSTHNELHATDMELFKAEHFWTLSMMPTQTIDRAARGARGWSFPSDDAPSFEDANNQHGVTYFADGLKLEALREGVMQLNPRTADVWRLCTAAILESWDEGEKQPPRVWLDARQLCDAMGFKKHHKGGHRPENVAIAARALVDLERFYITVPYGAKQYPEDANGKRKAVTVKARSRQRVLAVMEKEEIKQLFNTEWLPLRWQVTAGDWIKAYPRNQFAPLFRALVELPGTYTPDLWAKAIGTELVWQYRQDEGKVQTQRVETMLKQACVFEEAYQDKNKGRARDNFEKALDKLQEHGVCVDWEYNGADIDRVDATQKGWFNLWLQARVIVRPPPGVVKVLENLVKVKRQHHRRLKKA